MEPRQKGESAQNCFLPTGADQWESTEVGNDIYLYDEAEPLMYVCSETSMPPKSAGNVRGPQSATSPTGSSTSRRKSRKSSTMVYDSTDCQPIGKNRSVRSAEGRAPSNIKVSDFESQILSKFKEFTMTPNSSCAGPDECRGAVNVGTATRARSKEIKSVSKSQEVEELFVRNTKFVTSSSESEKIRISSEEQQREEYSTGMSDTEEGANITHDTKLKLEVKTDKSREIIDISSLPRWFATKSIVKHVEDRIERPEARTSPTRIGPPVQGRMSLRTMKATPPCFCLLNEIRKNNLVMKEDIFTSSTPTAEESHLKNPRNNSRTRERGPHKCSSDVKHDHQTSKDILTKRLLNKRGGASGTIEVYEATGGGVDAQVRKKDTLNTRQGNPASNLNALAANIQHAGNPFQELWRPFEPPQNDWSVKKTEPTQNVTAQPSKAKSVSKIEDSQELLSDPQSTDRENELTRFRYFNIQLDEYLKAKTSTPNRRPEKYVKLPGLAEAFTQRHSNFKDIRIKDGTSFESVNALEEMSMKNLTHRLLDIKNTEEYEDNSMRKFEEQVLELKKAFAPSNKEKGAKTKPETKDAATDLRLPMINTKTQTSDVSKTMVDGYVQCESHIIDETNGRNIIDNNHQEIMVCDENGDGVQLYNDLGHPLTDMDGYLLKDSLGRFLVRLDQYGVPITCTNGQGIYTEDSRQWDAVKNSMSIVHQSKKKLIKRSVTAKKKNGRPSLRQLELAMENLKKTLEWADKISLNSSNENSLNQFTDYLEERSPPKIKPTIDAEKLNSNTTSLIAEMKSIARLRNALLEKVNFIVDHRSKLKSATTATPKERTFPRKWHESYNESRSTERTSIWQGQERSFSPTYQAVKRLKDIKNENFMRFDALAVLPTLDEPSQKSRDDSPYIRQAGENRQKFENEPKVVPTRKRSANKASEADLWNSIDEKPTNNFTARKISANFDGFPDSLTNGYLTDKELEISGISLVSQDNKNLPGVSNLENVLLNDTAFTVSPLLVSLEKQYNLGLEKSWMESWKKERSLKDILDVTKKAKEWNNSRPSIESISSSSNGFRTNQHDFNY